MYHDYSIRGFVQPCQKSRDGLRNWGFLLKSTAWPWRFPLNLVGPWYILSSMKIQHLNDQELILMALRRTDGNQSRLAQLMTNTGVKITQVSIHRWSVGSPIVRGRRLARTWLEDFVTRTPEDFRVPRPPRARRRKNGKKT